MMRKNILSIAVIALFAFAACTKDDTTKPSIELKGDAIHVMKLNSTYVEPGYTATDDEDGDLTSSVVSTVSINASVPSGDNSVSYSVSDAAGNEATATRTVKVVLSAADIAGTYNVANYMPVAGTVYNYTDNVTYNNATPTKIYFTDFGGYNNCTVVADVLDYTLSCDQTLTVTVSGTDYSFNFKFTSCTFNGHSFTIFYDLTNGGTITHCKSTYTLPVK